MIDTKCRRIFQPFFDILAGPLAKMHMHPYILTFAAFLSGLASGFLLAAGHHVLPLILLWLSGLLDVLDGTVARLENRSSKTGAYLDLVLDRMVEAAVILGFAWAFPETVYACLLFFTAVLFNFSTFIAAGALFKNESFKSMHYDIGIAERTETFIVFSLLILFPSSGITILLTFDGVIFLTGILRFVRIIRRQ
jgi:archaetidylinositol phosphate synthase